MVSASIVCATTQSIETLMAVRFVQAFGGAGSIVLARAVVRDLYSGVRAGRELSLMGSITAFAPIVAPVIGGVLQTAFGWRASFYLLVIFAAVSAAAAARYLPETLRQRTPGPFSLVSMGRLYRSVLQHRGFLAYLGILTTTFTGLLSWVSAASIVMQGVYGLSPVEFGATYAVGAVGYMLGTHTAARIVMRLGLDRTIGIGAVALAIGGLAMVAVVALGLAHVAWLVGAMTIYLAGMGLVLPQTMAGALTPFPDRAGTASSRHGIHAAGLRRHRRRRDRRLSGPIGMAGRGRRRRDGLPRLADLGADARRAQTRPLNGSALLGFEHLAEDALVAHRPDIDGQHQRIERCRALSMTRCCASITGASCSSNAKRRIFPTFSCRSRLSFSSVVMTPKRTAVK